MALVRQTDLGGVIPAFNAMADQIERWARGELPPVVDPKVLGSWLEAGGVTTAALATGGVTLGKLATSYSDAPPGYSVALGVSTVPVVVGATTEATATAIVTASSFTADGARSVIVTFVAPAIQNTAANSIALCLYDGSTSQGQISLTTFPSAGSFAGPITAATRFVPAAGARTLSIRGFVNASNASVIAGTGGGIGLFLPLIMRVDVY